MKQEFPRRFGPYVLLKPLARGGMGALYLAVQGQRGMEKLCVVKTALHHLADKGYLQRFKDEAKIVVRLSHGNLVTVFDAGQVHGEIYLGMDFVEGKDLRAVWNRCAGKGIAFPVDVAVHIAKELTRGLAYAHSFEQLALVHRDVSPPNVLVSYSGEVKLTDFGLATSTLKLEKTAPGVIYGKVSYMAPEQARGEVLDGRADIYAAGIILWELLTGRQLFPATNAAAPAAPAAGAGEGTDDALLEQVRRPVIVAPSKRAWRVPVELDRIVLKALAVDPAHRYATGEDFRAELAAFLAKTAPATDGEHVRRFLRELFADTIEEERAERTVLLARARALLPAKGTGHVAAERPIPKATTPPKALPPAPKKTLPSPNPLTTSAETRAIGTDGLGLGGTPDEPSRLVGTLLGGRYKIRRLCGEGGMGRVYEAEHVEIGRRVAIKVLHPAYSRTPEVVERFRREARATSKIGHPNIVNVTDSGTTDDGSFFFVMEFVEGNELGLIIHREGPLPVSRALLIAGQMCQALQAAHDAGVIHRDLKPENVLLVAKDGGDLVKVLDFGIAKSAEMEESTRAGRRLTRPGVAMGTPEYMAPEQAAGKPADPRSDIYAVGSIMYEMLTAEPPYDGDNVMEILHKKANEAPTPIRRLRAEVPGAVEALVNRAMARTPAERPQSMGELAREIAAVLPMLGALEALESLPAPRRETMIAAPLDSLGGLTFGLSRRALGVAAGALVMVAALVIIRGATGSRPRPAMATNPTATLISEEASPTIEPSRASVDGSSVILVHEAETVPAGGVPDADPEPAMAIVLPPVELIAPAPDDDRRAGRPAREGALSPKEGRKVLAEAQRLFKAQRYDEARDAFTKLVEARREKAPALIGLAKIAFQAKNYSEAMTKAKLGAESGGGAEARNVLGEAYYRLERFPDAVKAYREALKLDPTNEVARRNLQIAEQRLN